MYEADEETYIPYVPNPRYEGLRQYAWKVSGPSVNRIARPGEYIIGVSLIDLRSNPPDGAPVVVERRRAGTFEYTVKRIRYRQNGVELVPDSDDPRFQEPVWATENGKHGEEIEVTHLVIGVYREL